VTMLWDERERVEAAVAAGPTEEEGP
jgi:hypothetical protein